MPTTTNTAKASRKRLEERVKREFPEDVAQHVMIVALEQGVYRHIECREPGTRNRLFTITTWPGELCISGDMGTFVFNRLNDMFEFFRNPRHAINSGYWSEKLVAPRGTRGATEYDPKIFRKEIERWLFEHLKSNRYPKEKVSRLREAVHYGVLLYADDGEQVALQAARDFEFEGVALFQDFWEVSCREYTYQFLWCCHAILWAIAQWDARPATERAA